MSEPGKPTGRGSRLGRSWAVPAALGTLALIGAFLYLGQRRKAPAAQLPPPAESESAVRVGRAEPRPSDSQTALLQVARPDGGPAIDPHLGEQVRLEFGPGQHRYAIVVVADGTKVLSVLWPPGAKESGRLESIASIGVTAPKDPQRVVAAFSDAPIAAQAAVSGLPRQGVEARELMLHSVP